MTWHHQGANGEVMSERLRGRPEQRKMASLILVLRNAMCLRSCETPPALRITFRKALAARPGSIGVKCQGKRLVSVDSSVSNLYTTLAPQPPGNRIPPVACFKGPGPHRKSHADSTAWSIESHCWQQEYQGAGFWVWAEGKTCPRKRCGIVIEPTSPYLSQVENLCGWSF